MGCKGPNPCRLHISQSPIHCTLALWNTGFKPHHCIVLGLLSDTPLKNELGRASKYGWVWPKNGTEGGGKGGGKQAEDKGKEEVEAKAVMAAASASEKYKNHCVHFSPIQY